MRKALFQILLITHLLLFTSFSTIAAAEISKKSMLANANDSTTDYLIITSTAFRPSIQQLAIWKQQRGLATTVLTLAEILEEYEGQDHAEKVRNCIDHFYKTKSTKWVLLAGNTPYVPTRSVAVSNNRQVICDQYYANLGENWQLNTDGTVSLINFFDWNNEVYIGRLPAENQNQMRELVERQLFYEREPPVGPWMTRAIFAGAFANFNVDLNNNSVLDEDDWPEFDANRCFNWIRNNIVPVGWISNLLGEVEGVKPTDYSYDLPLNEANFVEQINNGATVGATDAHGSPSGQWRTIFTEDNDNDQLVDPQVDKLESAPLIRTESNINTEGKYGFYFLCGCDCGDFELSGSCLAEYILQTCGIGCIASSGSAWYEAGWHERSHGGWRTQGLCARFWDRLLRQGENQPGKAYANAKLDYIHDYLALNEVEIINDKTLVQYNLLGDPEVPIWTAIPYQLEAVTAFTNSQTILEARANDQAVSNVTATLLNTTYYWRGQTESNGQIIIPLSQREFESLTLTLSKANYLPYQERAEICSTLIPQQSIQEQISTKPSGLTTDSKTTSSFTIGLIALLLLIKKKRGGKAEPFPS